MVTGSDLGWYRRIIAATEQSRHILRRIRRQFDRLYDRGVRTRFFDCTWTPSTHARRGLFFGDGRGLGGTCPDRVRRPRHQSGGESRAPILVGADTKMPDYVV